MKLRFNFILVVFFLKALLAQDPSSQVGQTRPAALAGQEPKFQLDMRPVKLDCANLDYLKKGRPVFAASKDGVRAGISTRKTVVALGEPVVVDIWIDNRSDNPISAGGRCPPYLHFGDVFDEQGRRMIGNREQQKLDAVKNGYTVVEVCATSEVISEIPAHTCSAPVDARGDNMTLDYNLAPGVYYLFAGRGTDPALYKQGLMITVREPSPTGP